MKSICIDRCTGHASASCGGRNTRCDHWPLPPLGIPLGCQRTPSFRCGCIWKGQPPIDSMAASGIDAYQGFHGRSHHIPHVPGRNTHVQHGSKRPSLHNSFDSGRLADHTARYANTAGLHSECVVGKCAYRQCHSRSLRTPNAHGRNTQLQHGSTLLHRRNNPTGTLHLDQRIGLHASTVCPCSELRLHQVAGLGPRPPGLSGAIHAFATALLHPVSKFHLNKFLRRLPRQ